MIKDPAAAEAVRKIQSRANGSRHALDNAVLVKDEELAAIIAVLEAAEDRAND